MDSEFSIRLRKPATEDQIKWGLQIQKSGAKTNLLSLKSRLSFSSKLSQIINAQHFFNSGNFIYHYFKAVLAK